jgi:replicative DNA helicase
MSAPYYVVPEEQEMIEGVRLPHSLEAEEALCGAVLVRADCYFEALRDLPGGASEFFIHRLRYVWQAYERLAGRKAAIDSLTVSNELHDMGRLGDIGGPSYLTALLNQVYSTLNVDEYAVIVHQAHIRRGLIEAASKIATVAYNQAEEMEAVIAQASGSLAVALKQSTRSKMMSGNEAIRAMDTSIEIRRGGGITGVPTGLTDLDALFGGSVEGGKLVCVAGRPGDGKSALMSTWAVNQIKAGYHPALFSLEMGAEELSERIVSQYTGLDSQIIHKGAFSDDEWPIYNNAIEQLGTSDGWHIDYASGCTVDYIALQCEQLYSRGLLSSVFIDQLDKLRSKTKFTKTVELYDHLMNALKVEVAMRFNVPVFVAAQMNRTAERENNRQPRMSDLNEGGEKDSDVVIFIWKDDEPQSQNVRHLVMAKHRGGPVGIVDTIWRANCVRFENAAARTVNLREDKYE